MTNDKKRCAFTLVEIMITIGIIGIVAAITIPTMIQNSNSKKFATQLKKSVSTLNQASIGAQAQYDVNYSMMTTESADATCGSDSLAKGDMTFCSLLNTTLAGQTYLGTYGQKVKSASGFGLYSMDAATINPSNFLIYSFSDGAFVGFNPNATNCTVGAGKILTTEMLTENLSNCIGFIDVNGANGPNSEIECKKPSRDVYPIVFHDGAVELATDAARNGGECLTEEEKLAKRRQFDKWVGITVKQGLSYDECMSIKDQYGIENCSVDNDYWAAAVVQCGGVQNLPTDDDLYALAKIIYSNCSGGYCTGYDSSRVPSGVSRLGNGWSGLLSAREPDAGVAVRYFGPYSRPDSYYRNASMPFVCVGDL